MFQTLRNAWALPDLRKKILYTLFIIVLFRIGSAITVPFLNSTALASLFNQNQGNLFGYIDMLTGGAFSHATIFAMSVSPYINASIILQLLAVAIPALERLQKEGETGRRKIAQITRYITVVLALIQGFFYYIYLRNSGIVLTSYNSGFKLFWAAAVIIVCFTAGASLLMWLGEQINDKGIGNGISIILFAGIISRVPAIIGYLAQYWNLAVNGQTQYFYLVPLVVIVFFVIIVAIVAMNDAERRIPVQYAKRVVGRKMYGGQNTFIPIKVTMSGVMPIIFASSIISVPGLILQFFNIKSTTWWGAALNWFKEAGWLYAIIYFVLIIAFNYFYVNIQYNPYEMANNLKKNNGGIPGIRPGRPTIEYIKNILYRVTLIGALFLGVVAVAPLALSFSMNVSVSLGGTSLLIIVGVAYETMRTLESQMMMRHYKGFLE